MYLTYVSAVLLLTPPFLLRSRHLKPCPLRFCALARPLQAAALRRLLRAADEARGLVAAGADWAQPGVALHRHGVTRKAPRVKCVRALVAAHQLARAAAQMAHGLVDAAVLARIAILI